MRYLNTCSIGQVLAVLLMISQCPQPVSASPILSEQAIASVPNVLTRMQSPNVQVCTELIDELIVNESNGDVMWTSLRYELTDQDYSIILQTALRGIATELPDDDSLRMLYIVRHISRTHTLTGIEQAIYEFAQSPSSRVSRRAVRILVHLKSPLATQYLIPQLQDPQKYYGAIKSLVAVNGTAAVPHIKAMLPASDKNMQHWAIWALFEFDARQYADHIYNSSVQNRPWRDIAPYALAVLTKWQDSRVYPLVMNHLTDSDRTTRDIMASRLMEVNATAIEDSVIDFLESRRIVSADKGTDKKIKADAMGLLVGLGSRKVVPLLRDAVTREKGSLKYNAARMLGVLKAKEAVPELLSMLDSGKYSDWSAATIALAQIGDPSTVERILAEVKKKKPNQNHAEVLENLAKVSAPQTYQMLRDIELPPLTSLPVEEYFAQVSDKAGIAVSLSDGILKEHKDRVVVRGGQTALSALRHGVSVLNYSGFPYALFIEENLVHVVPVEEAYAKWKDWLKTHPPG